MRSRPRQPDLRGQVCLLADAGTATAYGLHHYLTATGASMLTLSDDTRRVPTAAGTDAPSVAASASMTDADAMSGAMTWMMSRAQRLDVAVVAHDGEADTRVTLALLATQQLAMTAQFHAGPPAAGLLVYLAPPGTQEIERLRAALDVIVFGDRVLVVTVDAWPDTWRSTRAAVAQVLARGKPATALDPAPRTGPTVYRYEAGTDTAHLLPVHRADHR